MKTIRNVSKNRLLEMAFLLMLQQKLNVPFTFDTTAKTIKLVSLRKELYCKHSSNDNGEYYYYFTKNLLDDLKRAATKFDNPADFCVGLFCEDSESPCILTSVELSELVEQLGRDSYFNLYISIEGKSFKLVAVAEGGAKRCEMTISKRVSTAKLMKLNA